jgi:hypothetical protein
MQLFTALLSALALVTSTTTANPQGSLNMEATPPPLDVIEPGSGVTWNTGSSEVVLWETNGMSQEDSSLTGSIILGNRAINNQSCKLLPNLLCFTVVVTQQFLSFTCTCNPLFSEHSAASNRRHSGSWARKCHRAERATFHQLFYYS